MEELRKTVLPSASREREEPLKAAYGILPLIEPCRLLHPSKRMRSYHGIGGGNDWNQA